jgi:carbon storage regulator
MLVLSRSAGEEILIGDNVRVRIVDVTGNKVRLGITAPLNVAVRREDCEPPPAKESLSGHLAAREDRPAAGA